MMRIHWGDVRAESRQGGREVKELRSQRSRWPHGGEWRDSRPCEASTRCASERQSSEGSGRAGSYDGLPRGLTGRSNSTWRGPEESILRATRGGARALEAGTDVEVRQTPGPSGSCWAPPGRSALVELLLAAERIPIKRAKYGIALMLAVVAGHPGGGGRWRTAGADLRIGGGAPGSRHRAPRPSRRARSTGDRRAAAAFDRWQLLEGSRRNGAGPRAGISSLVGRRSRRRHAGPSPRRRT